MLLFIGYERVAPTEKRSFNTSHVVIYLKATNGKLYLVTFQYISCCYLSPDGLPELTGSIQFQYISCCYLSDQVIDPTTDLSSFNTSHVVIYQWRKTVCLLSTWCFNTSHVVIYQKLAISSSFVNSSFNTSHVVIYRLVLFQFYQQMSAFQYISCCYLSDSKMLSHPSLFVSIHLMLLFIRSQCSLTLNSLRFNTSHVVIYLEREHNVKIGDEGFNTSHVVIYPRWLPLFHLLPLRFNTSHVVIYRIETLIICNLYQFQYISCCYLS